MFVAAVPSEAAIADLARFVEPRLDDGGPLRWTSQDQWHLTLTFLPAVPDDSLDELCDQLAATALRRQALALSLSGAGAFPNPARAKALWLGVHGDTDALAHLATGTRNAAVRSGTEVDGSRFRPHLTLARLGRPIDVTRWLRIFDSYAGPSWAVDDIALVESHLGEGPRGRPRYRTHATFPLLGQA